MIHEDILGSSDLNRLRVEKRKPPKSSNFLVNYKGDLFRVGVIRV
jgi:hypothetical protein